MAARRFAAVVAAAVAAVPAAGQFARYELGRRLRVLEASLEAAPAPDRARVAPAMDRAVKAFFALDQQAAVRELARAQAVLAGGGEPPWAASLACSLSARLADPESRLTIRVVSVFDVDAEPPADVEVALRWLAADGAPGPVVATASLAPLAAADAPVSVEVGLADLAPGDHLLRAEIGGAGSALAVIDQTVSVVHDLDRRLGDLEAAVGDRDEGADRTSVDVATARRLCRLLRHLAGGRTVETDLPAARLLAEAEALVQTIAAGEGFFAAGPAGEHWLQVPVGDTSLPVRLWAPAATEPRPLVVALHGAGGSDNMFFAAYGAGLAVRLARERGWIIAAPGLGLGSRAALVDLVAALAALYRIDQQRVFVVGHSMGAALAVTATGAAPARFRAVAALGGGGGRLAAGTALARLPFFVAAGELDFARASAAALVERLRARSAAVEWHEYPGVEHLGVVQRALPDVFRFFDGHLQ